MRLIAKGSEADPWKIDPSIEGCDMLETADGVSREAAFWDAAGQTASDAGSDLLETPNEWDRDRLRLDIFDDMCRYLRNPGDLYSAPDGVVYVLEDEPDWVERWVDGVYAARRGDVK